MIYCSTVGIKINLLKICCDILTVKKEVFVFAEKKQ